MRCRSWTPGSGRVRSSPLSVFAILDRPGIGDVKAEVIRTAAETQRLQAMAKAKARLIEAMAKLRAEGGEVYFDRENLEAILRIRLPPAEDKGQASGTSEDVS